MAEEKDPDDLVPKGLGYRLLCELRQRGIAVYVDGGSLLDGRWVGGSLVARPGDLLVDTERATLKKYGAEIRALLAFMLPTSTTEALSVHWETEEACQQRRPEVEQGDEDAHSLSELTEMARALIARKIPTD
jgi:hypothetical protein